MEQKKLFLLDAYALIFRAYYAFINRPIRNSKGMNTSAVFGFTNSLVEILEKEKPTHIAVVFDPPSPTFRHEMYKEYKANRLQTPEDIRISVPYIKKIIEGFNIKHVEVIGYEADDVIGALAKRAEKEGFQTYMMTPDKDYAQLVSENIFMYKPRHSSNDAEILGVEEVKKRFEVENPLQVIDILALWGDASDNVPGAPGIGEKTAKKLIHDFGSVEQLIENVDKLKGKQKETVINFKEQIELSKKLVTIALDVPLEQNFNDFESKQFDRDKLNEIFTELEFKTIANRILGNITKKEQNSIEPVQGNLFSEDNSTNDSNLDNLSSIYTVDHSYQLIQNQKERSNLINFLRQQKSFCFDTETTGLDVQKAEIVGLAISFKEHEAYYVIFPKDQKETQHIMEEFRPVFEDKSIGKIGQNIKYDIQIFKRYNIQVNGELFDTMLAHYLVQPELKHNLNYLAERYLHYQCVSIEELIGKKGKGQLNMRQVDAEKQREYAGEDADITLQLAGILHKELKENNLMELAEKIEMPLINVLADMENAGFKININDLEKYAGVLREEIIQIEKSIYEQAGTQFNISSPKQLGDILFEKLKISDNAKKTKTKQYSTSEDVLVRLKDKHEIVANVLDYRSLTKLLSTYIEALPKLINKETGKIHTSYNQAIAATGRLSSNNPNLQNIPIREERGREIRKSFVASSDDYLLLAADYSQIELRIMAHMSEDTNMITAFNNDEDIHTATAAKIYNVPLEDVTREMRSKAKTANFGIIYGISAFGLSQRLNIPRSEAKDLIDGYFKTYPKVGKYMENSILLAKDKGYVTTLMGRKRYLPDINSGNAMVRGIAERNAINAPIQGSAADIIKLAMINIHNKIKDSFKSKMILQVHDELIFDTLKTELDDIKKLVKQEMESAFLLKVPLIVDMGEGKNWLEAH